MKKLSTFFAVTLTSVILTPVFVYAQGAADVARGIGTFAGLVDNVTTTVVKSVASLLLALALLAFFYGIVEYIWAKRSGDTKGVADGNKFMTAGLIALFVMFSVYGIIKFAQTTIFGNADMTSISIPNINFKSGAGSPLVPAAEPSSPGARSPLVPAAEPSSPGSQYTVPTRSCPDGSHDDGTKCVDDALLGD